MDPAAYNPTTPTKQREEAGHPIKTLVDRLNDDYNLGIQVSDPTESPSASRRRGGRGPEHHGIYSLLQFHYYKSDLDKILAAFSHEAADVCSQWVRKPRGDDDVLPGRRGRLRASNHAESQQLRQLLHTLLRNAFELAGNRGPTGVQATGRSSTRAKSGPSTLAPAASSVEAPNPRRSKRLSGDSVNKASKRAKPDVSDPSNERPGRVQKALDKVPMRQKLGGGPEPVFPPFKLPGPANRTSFSDGSSIFTSANTSKVSLVFSTPGEPPPATQSTVAVGTQERKFQGTPPKASITSSGDILALQESFRQFEQSFVKPNEPQDVPDRPSSAGVSGSTVYSSFSADDMLMEDAPPRPAHREHPEPSALETALRNAWPMFPQWLNAAPLAVAWEVTRIANHCKVELNELTMSYDESWRDYNKLRRDLRQLPAFSSASFPQRPSSEAWTAAIKDNLRGNGDDVVVLSAALDFRPQTSFASLDLRPLQLERGTRLSRHFGPDRFLELLIPTSGYGAPSILKGANSPAEIAHWLAQERHFFLGRQWAAFFVRDVGHKSVKKDLNLGVEQKTTPKVRVFLFAEDGNDFVRDDAVASNLYPKIKIEAVLDWLLRLDRNGEQPFLKLFSRIQLGLSKTINVLTFEPHQIHHKEQDILSPAEKVMNDGIGRMSRAVARAVAIRMGLDSIPSAIQGRLGSAKGMWIISDELPSSAGELWIETYPSQRKWTCNWLDPDHRTLEVREVPGQPRSASVNLQFLPVLEDRARSRPRMREAISQALRASLDRELEAQKTALRSPEEFRAWNQHNLLDRVKNEGVAFLAGLPARKEEVLNFLLDCGFDPMQQKYLQDIAWDLQKQKCEQLRTKLNIRIGRSVWLYLVVDFAGVLEEDEVHIGFSSSFHDPDGGIEGFSGTMVHGVDVLVARSPAHFVSDIQRVKAAFKPELRHLQDVIVFPIKGNAALADKLSGGDYDGDKAWVCWDPDVVENFVSADVPPEPKDSLSRYVSKEKTTFEELRRSGTLKTWLERSFQFNLQPSLLGACTNYKDRYAYHHGTVSSDSVVLLNYLLSNLVDQAKQGIIFTEGDWERMRDECFKSRSFPDQKYKGELWDVPREPKHIVDFLKFRVVKQAIDAALESLHKTMMGKTGGDGSGSARGAVYWDPDLAVYYDQSLELQKSAQIMTETSRQRKELFQNLRLDIAAVEREWKLAMKPDNFKRELVPYGERVDRIYQTWCDIKPKTSSRNNEPLIQALLPDRIHPEQSEWALYKASVAYKMYIHKNAKFVWAMAGRHLGIIKAKLASGERPFVPVIQRMYAALVPNRKYVRQVVAKRLGESTETGGDDDGEDDGELDGADAAAEEDDWYSFVDGA